MAVLSKKHKKVDIPAKPEWWTLSIPSSHIITLSWDNQSNTWWNQACADVLEVFGLPGHRYYYKPYPDYMKFTFKSKKDADLCRILLSDKITAQVDTDLNSIV
jgi:hypothetical protein